jgi:hypothetical protein
MLLKQIHFPLSGNKKKAGNKKFAVPASSTYGVDVYTPTAYTPSEYKGMPPPIKKK